MRKYPLFLLILLFLPFEKLNVASAATLSFRCSGTITKSIKQNLVKSVDSKSIQKYSHLVLIDLKKMKIINKDGLIDNDGAIYTIREVTPATIYFYSPTFRPINKIVNIIEQKIFEGTFNRQSNSFSSEHIDYFDNKDSKKYSIFKIITNTKCVMGT